jgi:hypothetical protein
MPDGDKVHSKLPWRYQRPYKRLCESKTSSQEPVWELMKALLKDIRQKGDNFLKTAQLLSEELKNHLVTIRFQGNLARFREDIDKSIKNSNLSHYDQQILIQASQNLQKKIQNNILNNSLEEEMIAESFYMILCANFIGRLPLNQAHYAGVDDQVLQERINDMTPEIQSIIYRLSKKANQKGSVSNLRLPRRKNRQVIGMDEDLS